MRLGEKYKKEVLPKLMEEFDYKNIMAVPKIKKVVLNSSFGKRASGKDSSEREKIINNTIEVLKNISGQKPKLTKARISIASFKLREGVPVGAKVTLRGQKMFGFLEKLISVVLPRTRDFQGISLKSLDKSGNLTIGFEEYGPFPEVIAEREKNIFGLEVTIVTKAKSREESLELLKLMGVPFKKES